MQVKTIVNGVAGSLGDPTFITWSRSDLIKFLNRAVKQLVLVRPDSSSSTESMPMVAGTLQNLPGGALRLLKVVRNMGADGATPGRVVKFADADVLDSLDPNWHSATQRQVIKSFSYDERTPNDFYVYPPSDGATQIEVKVSRLPAELDPDMDDAVFNDAATLVGVKDIYENPLTDWMKFEAYSVESSSQVSGSRAGFHHQAFYSALGLKTNTDAANSPESTNGSA